MLAGELGQTDKQVVAAAFRTRRSDRPGREPAFVPVAKQFIHDAERIGPSAGAGGPLRELLKLDGMHSRQ